MKTYTEQSPELRDSVAALLNCDSSIIERVNIAVSNPIQLKSASIIELYPTPTLQMLLCIYSPDGQLHDVISFRGNRFFRVKIGGENTRHIRLINEFIQEGLFHSGLSEIEEGGEQDDSAKDNDTTKLQIQQLRDRSRVDRNIIKSLRGQVRLLRQRKK